MAALNAQTAHISRDYAIVTIQEPANANLVTSQMFHPRNSAASQSAVQAARPAPRHMYAPPATIPAFSSNQIGEQIANATPHLTVFRTSANSNARHVIHHAQHAVDQGPINALNVTRTALSLTAPAHATKTARPAMVDLTRTAHLVVQELNSSILDTVSIPASVQLVSRWNMLTH